MPPRMIAIELDRERHIKLDLNALVAVEERTGKSFQDLDVGSLSMTEMRSFLWACLKWEDPELTEEMVGSFIDVDNLGDVVQGLGAAINGVAPPGAGMAEVSRLPNRTARRARATG